MGAVDADTAGPGAFFIFLLFSMPGLLEGTEASGGGAEIAQFDALDFAFSGEQLSAVIRQVRCVGGGQSNTGNDNSLVIVKHRSVSLF